VLQAARADGSLVPFWTHLLSSGRPLLANPGYALLAPLNVVYVLFPFHLAFNVFLVAHVFVGATGMAFLARRLGCSRVAAFAAGAAYGLGGGMISAIALYWTAVSAGWAPWVLAAGHAACEKPTRRHVALLALALGVQALGGQPEPILATLLVGAFMSLAMASGSALRRAGIVAATWGIAGIWGIMIAAPQLVPAALHARTTYRSLGFDAGQILYNSLDPRALPGLVLPRWGGSPMDSLTGGFQGAAWTDTGTPYLLSHYLGLSIIALALVGAWHLARSRGMPGLASALSLAAIAGVVIALGRHVPGATALMDALPFEMPLRYPVKALHATFLAIPPLAAFGLDALIASRIARWAPLLAAVVALDLILAHGGFAPTASPDAFEEPPLSLELKARAQEIGIVDGQWRIHHQRLEGGAWDTTSDEVERSEEAHYEWRRRMLIPPTGAPFGIHHAMERSGDLLDDLQYLELTRRAYASPPPEWARALGEEAVLFVISPFDDLEARTEGVLTHVEALDARQGLPAGSGHLYFNAAFREIGEVDRDARSYTPRGLVAGGIACIVGLLGVVACLLPARRAITPS
jgi:hypothetical protein